MRGDQHAKSWLAANEGKSVSTMSSAHRTNRQAKGSAGTDAGLSYRSPDQEQEPAQPISRIESPPVSPAGAVTPVGTFRFVRIDETS